MIYYSSKYAPDVPKPPSISSPQGPKGKSISESSCGVGEAAVWLAVELPFNDKSFVDLTAAGVTCHRQKKNKLDRHEKNKDVLFLELIFAAIATLAVLLVFAEVAVRMWPLEFNSALEDDLHLWRSVFVALRDLSRSRVS